MSSKVHGAIAPVETEGRRICELDLRSVVAVSNITRDGAFVAVYIPRILLPRTLIALTRHGCGAVGVLAKDSLDNVQMRKS